MVWKLIDCTLRDGGNLNDWHYPDRYIAEALQLLDRAGVDVIEVGYRGGSGSNKAKRVGPTAHCKRELMASLPVFAHAKRAVMCVPTVCPLQELDELPELGIDMVRIATYPADADGALPYLEHARKLGLDCSLNLMAASYLEPGPIGALARRAQDAGAGIFYMADSFGGMNPDDVRVRVHAARESCGRPIGFHGHNNLGLAFANALAALEAGATYLDGSLCGMGRGAGNLPTEQLIAAAETWEHLGRRFDPDAVLEAAELTMRLVLTEPMHVSTAELETGLGNVHYYYHGLIREESESSGLSRRQIARALGALRPPRVDKAFVDQAVRSISGRS